MLIFSPNENFVNISIPIVMLRCMLPVHRRVPQPVHVPYPVERFVDRPVPYPVERIVEERVPVPVTRTVDRPIPVPVERVVVRHVEVPVTVKVPQHVPLRPHFVTQQSPSSFMRFCFCLV